MASSIDPHAFSSCLDLLKQAKPLFEGSDGGFAAWVGVVGVVAGVFASYFPQLWQARRQERRLANSVASQIYAEIKGMLRIEQHRHFIESLRDIVGQFDRKEITEARYEAQIGDERFIVYRANIHHLGILQPQIHANIVNLYQMLESVLLDVKPGGLLNATLVGREPFAEDLRMLVEVRALADDTLAQLEKAYRLSGR